MTATGDLRVDWVVHRPKVVRSVAAHVPGVDAEEAASRALEKMVRLVSTGATIDDPAPYWRRAAINEAISMTREAGRAHAVEDDTLDRLTPPIAGAELDAERHADVTMLRTALSDLADDDRDLLLQRHVHDRAVADIATNLGVRPHAVTMRLRRAEERLAGAFAAAHAQGVNEPECRTTRAAMHDYLKGRLLPRRQQRLEVHMDGCAECTRAFVDVREVSWMLRDLGQHLIAGGWATGAVGTAAVGTGVVGAGGAVGASAPQPRAFGRKETAVAAGVLAVLAVGAGAAALIANLGDEPPVQAVAEAEAAEPPSLPGPPEPPAQERPPPVPPADPEPRPATTPKEDAVPAPVPEPKAAEPEPEPEPEPERADVPPSAPDIEPVVERPAPQAPADKPAAPAPAPEPKPRPEPEPNPDPPRPTPPPPAVDSGGPPGNPSNPNGRGPAKDNDQGPGNGNGRGNGNGNGNGRGNGHGDGKGPGRGNGKGNGRSSDHSTYETRGFAVTDVPGTLLGSVG